MDNFNLCIKNKHALRDLAQYGSEARKKIHPDVLIGSYNPYCPQFHEGDILDANATLNLIASFFSKFQCQCLKGKAFTYEDFTEEQLQGLVGPKGEDGLSGVGIASMQQIQSSEEDGGENIWLFTLTNGDTLSFVVKNGNSVNADNYTHEFLTQDKYDALENIDPNVIYFIMESEPAESFSTFTSTFPITLS